MPSATATAGPEALVCDVTDAARVGDLIASSQPTMRASTFWSTMPEEVARLALDLCSDEAAFVTGQAYPIDGGVLVS